MTYELVQGVVIFAAIIAGLMVRALLLAAIEGARLRTSALGLSATSFRSILLTLKTNQMQNIATHVAFLLAILVLALPLVGTASVATLPVLSILWLVPLTCIIFDETGVKDSKHIVKVFALAISSVLLCAMALESSVIIKGLCIFLVMLIARETRLAIFATNQWNVRSHANLPLHFAQYATSTLFFVFLFKEIFFTNDMVVYALAIGSELFAYLIVDGLFSLPNLKRNNDSKSKAMMFLLFCAVVIVTALSLVGVAR